MTHDELLAKLEGLWHDSFKAPGYQALRAVVELHKPKTDEDGELVCSSCLVGQDDKSDDYYFLYPCYTIKAIEPFASKGVEVKSKSQIRRIAIEKKLK